MAWAHRATATGTGDSGTITVTKPPGTAIGDLLVCTIAVNRDQTTSGISGPAGWTRAVQNNFSTAHTGAIFWKIATSTETAATNFAFTYSDFTTSPTQYGCGVMSAFTGISSTDTEEVAGSGTGENVAPVCPDVTTVNDNALVIRGWAGDNPTSGGTDLPATTGATSEANAIEHPASDNNGATAAQGYENQATAGATGTATGTRAKSANEQYVGMTVAFKEDTGGAAANPHGPLKHPFSGPFGGPI